MEKSESPPPLDNTLVMMAITELGLDDKDALIKERVALELVPVLEQHKQLIVAAAEAIRSKDKTKIEAVVDEAIAAFEGQGCQLEFAFQEDLSNPATLDFKEGAWILKQDPIMFFKNVAALTEYLHELIALSLLKNRLKGEAPKDLRSEKFKMIVGTRTSPEDSNQQEAVALTHIFDKLFRLMYKTSN